MVLHMNPKRYENVVYASHAVRGAYKGPRVLTRPRGPIILEKKIHPIYFRKTMTVKQMKEIQRKNQQLAKTNTELLEELKKTQDELADVRRQLYTSQATLKDSFLEKLAKQLKSNLKDDLLTWVELSVDSSLDKALGIAKLANPSEIITHKRLSGDIPRSFSAPSVSGLTRWNPLTIRPTQEAIENHRRLSVDRMAQNIIDKRAVNPSVSNGILTPVVEMSYISSEISTTPNTPSNLSNCEQVRPSEFVPSDHSTEARKPTQRCNRGTPRPSMPRPSIFDFNPENIGIDLVESSVAGDFSFRPSLPSFIEHASFLEGAVGGGSTSTRQTLTGTIFDEESDVSTHGVSPRTDTIMPQDYGDLTNSSNNDSDDDVQTITGDDEDNKVDELMEHLENQGDVYEFVDDEETEGKENESTNIQPSEHVLCHEIVEQEPSSSTSIRGKRRPPKNSQKQSKSRKRKDHDIENPTTSTETSQNKTSSESKKSTGSDRGTRRPSTSLEVTTNDISQSDLMDMSVTRERRARKNVSYKEPPIGRKVRRGDPNWCKESV